MARSISILAYTSVYILVALVLTTTVILNFSMRQYLEVKLKDGKKLELDLWAYDMGLPFGKGAKGFV